jgi:hypothetical protein
MVYVALTRRKLMPRTQHLLALLSLLVVASFVAAMHGAGAVELSAPGVEDMASPAGPGSAEPNLAVDGDGRVYLSWLEPTNDSGHALRFATNDERAWEPTRTIRSGRDFFVNWADFPSIEVVGPRHLVAHWLQRTGRGSYAYGVRLSQSRDGGASWDAPITPHRDSGQAEHGFVALWPERGGTGAVWLDGRKLALPPDRQKKEMMLVATTLRANGTLAGESTIDQRTCDCCQTAAAVTSNGPVLAYRDRSPDEIRDIYVVRRVRGRWTTPVAVNNDGWHINACPVNGPALAAQGSDVVIAWFTAPNDSARVKVAFSEDAGATFGRPIVVDGGNPAGRVDAMLLGDRRALVSWIERTRGDTAAVMARVVSPAGPRGAPVTIAASSAARASGFPRMVLAREHAIFAWTEPGRPTRVRVARLKVADLR